MEVILSPSSVTLTLSRRNLKSLLAKLDGHPPTSKCSLVKDYGGFTCVVKAEEDDVHYGQRNPGAMHEATEANIAQPRS